MYVIHRSTLTIAISALLSLLLASCGADVTNDSSASASTGVSTANLPKEESVANTANPSGRDTKAGVAFGPNAFVDMLDEDETIVAISVCSSNQIDSLQLHTSKRSLPRQGSDAGSCARVELNAGEQILKVWGSAGAAIQTIGFDTNQGRQFGPYGNAANGTAFGMTVYGGPQARFRGWRGLVGNANAGIMQLTLIQQGMGGAGGAPFTDRMADGERVSEIKTCWRNAGFVNSIQMETNIGRHTLHGGNFGNQQCRTDALESDEYLVEINGRAGAYVNAVGYKTNKGRQIGPYGGTGGNAFSQTLSNPTQFYGLYGRSGSWMDQIGFIEPAAGGNSGALFVDALPAGKTINAIEVCSGLFNGLPKVRAVQAYYDGSVAMPRHGPSAQAAPSCQRIDLQTGETISEMSGRTSDTVDSLNLRTNFGRHFGPFGDTTGVAGSPFVMPNPWPNFLGFAGRTSRPGFDNADTIVAIDFATPDNLPVSAAPKSQASVNGWWDTPANWPVIGIHSAILGDGRLLSYGTSLLGEQGAQNVYDVWDPKLGFGPSSHMTLPNMLGVDMFCSSQSLLSNGKLLLAGGDLRERGVNRGIRNSTLFDPNKNELEAGPLINRARWYNSQVVLSDGQVLTLGGIDENATTSTTPEVYTGTQWRTLPGAADPYAYTSPYTRAFSTKSVLPNGRAVWIISTYNNHIYRLEVDGNGGTGELIDSGVVLPSFSSWDRPSAMISSNEVLVQLDSGKTIIVTLPNAGDANEKPSITDAGQLSQVRSWSEMVVLPTGDVLAVNGSAAANQLVDVAYHAEIWSRSTKTWRRLSSQLRPRLYHSGALLLADGRVLSVGGGAPGPNIERNAQAFTPPYLFNAYGGLAYRPIFNVSSLASQYGSRLSVTASTWISRVTLIKLGSTTHSNNTEQRFIELGFAANRRNRIEVTMPSDPATAPPGFYLMSVIDRNGVPSESKIIRLSN